MTQWGFGTLSIVCFYGTIIMLEDLLRLSGLSKSLEYFCPALVTANTKAGLFLSRRTYENVTARAEYFSSF